MQVWPAIDIRGGHCVRLSQGDYARETLYGANPADMACRWEADGATGLHVVDLDGAREGTRVNRRAVQQIVEQVAVPVQLGGGIRDEETIKDYVELGVSRIVIGTRGFLEPDWLVRMTETFPNRLLVGIDARDGCVATEGWQQTSDVSATEWGSRVSEQSIAGIIYTDIAKDGMLGGPNFDAMREMDASVSVPLICSGGVTSGQDVAQLAAMGIGGCIIGRALYEGRLTFGDALTAAQADTPSHR